MRLSLAFPAECGGECYRQATTQSEGAAPRPALHPQSSKSQKKMEEMDPEMVLRSEANPSAVQS